jgi:hypothetical protein
MRRKRQMIQGNRRGKSIRLLAISAAALCALTTPAALAGAEPTSTTAPSPSAEAPRSTGPTPTPDNAQQTTPPTTTESVSPDPKTAPDRPAEPISPVPAPPPAPVLADPPALPAAPAPDQPLEPENDELSSKTAEPDPDWAPTKDPKATVVPGQMRSDQEEIPAPFTKADADKAETMEARQRMARVAAGCQVYWPSPYEVCGAIKDKYNSLGGPGSFLSFPNSAELTNPGGTGARTQFLNGPIYWSGATGAHPVVNSFLNRWGVHGYEGGWLKYPTTDEIVLPDGGRRQEFQGGAIYVAFQNAVGSAIRNGPLRDKYNAVGGLAPGGTLLGYPIQDQVGLPDGQGQMDRFQNGVIYWHPTTGAWPVTGDILNVWSSENYEQGDYGYPVADQIVTGTYVNQSFQGSTIGVTTIWSGTLTEADGIKTCSAQVKG